ncbi:acetylornithine deacetylase [Komagataeibacter rhaeticus]|uniref:acetylornithine deacetylase n=1 Tax=Komagataeibacter rhaeticus TaxID=215221 RepID=UPI0004D9E775|nr:acetylornithine deacetylase [Komagataeibacter rhaeticus]KDU97279.1 acetylornithine deacetylase [Komagataeibacter rhaeticus AF1]MBL7239772.1 acetylornithine deacetylase [Komagataeibacter rhaeticus]PYD53347.1 acetylornithine deacetylase [Komagataeibacter rhaeticus]GBQ12152.1 acetylornithine deacetylase ArgE [Komagataeibacter rhaeticus DSM 16663]
MTPTVSTLRELVAFPSVCGEPNGAIIDWVETFLARIGARIRRIPGDRPDASSLFASIGPDVAGGIVLSAHADVVPVAGQDWTADPFVLTERDGRLYGRGSSDMKGFLACMLTSAARAATRPLKRPLHLAISYDEELGCLGVHSLLRALDSAGTEVDGCIIGEPTEMRVAIAHKGKIAFRIICRGEAAHSANPFLGRNAIRLAAGMVEALDRLQEHIRATETHDTRFTVPFSTVQAGLIQGGCALNIVPDLCTVTAEMRLVPTQDGAAYLAWLKEATAGVIGTVGGGTITLEVMNAYPGLNSPPGTDICSLALHEAGQNSTTVIDFGTEAGLFEEKLGVACVVCGPGSINRAHKADEYITRSELDRCDLFLEGVVDRLCQ